MGTYDSRGGTPLVPCNLDVAESPFVDAVLDLLEEAGVPTAVNDLVVRLIDQNDAEWMRRVEQVEAQRDEAGRHAARFEGSFHAASDARNRAEKREAAVRADMQQQYARAQCASTAVLEAAAAVCDDWASQYPTDIFPENGTSSDAIAARTLRRILPEIAKAIRNLELPGGADGV